MERGSTPAKATCLPRWLQPRFFCLSLRGAEGTCPGGDVAISKGQRLRSGDCFAALAMTTVVMSLFDRQRSDSRSNPDQWGVSPHAEDERRGVALQRICNAARDLRGRARTFPATRPTQFRPNAHLLLSTHHRGPSRTTPAVHFGFIHHFVRPGVRFRYSS